MSPQDVRAQQPFDPSDVYQSRARDPGEPTHPQDLYPLGTPVRHRVHGEVTYHGTDRADPSGDTHWIRTKRGDEWMVSSTLERVAAGAPSGQDMRAQVQRRILDAHTAIAGGLNDFAHLDAIRARLADVPREELDAALIDLHRRGVAQLDPAFMKSMLTPAQRAAAVQLGGENMHLFAPVRRGGG